MSFLCLLHLATTTTHSDALVATDGSAIRLCPLSARRKALYVTHTSIRLDILETLNVLLDLPLEISFCLEPLNFSSNLVFLLRGKLCRLQSAIEAKLIQYHLGSGTSYAIDCCKRDFKALVFWKCDT